MGHRPGECPVGLNQDFAPVPIEGFTCSLFRELAGFDFRFGARKLRSEMTGTRPFHCALSVMFMCPGNIARQISRTGGSHDARGGT